MAFSVDGLTVYDDILAKYFEATTYIKSFIVLHYTANSGTTATAKGNANYFASCDRYASAHLVVDENVAYLCVPLDMLAYSVGGTIYPATKGAAFSGKCGNANSISIEMVSHSDANGYYIPEKTVENALKLVRWLQQKYGIDNDHVIRHYDVNGKPCPWCWTDVQGYDGERLWNSFKARLGGADVIEIPAEETPVVSNETYCIKVTADVLNIRKEPNASSQIMGTIPQNGVYTIVAEQNGWGKLKSGAGWIALAYTVRYVVASVASSVYCIKVTASVLNIRKNPTVNSNVVGAILRNGVYTIVSESTGDGATKWGKLKSGAGWISLDYVTKI